MKTMKKKTMEAVNVIGRKIDSQEEKVGKTMTEVSKVIDLNYNN